MFGCNISRKMNLTCTASFTDYWLFESKSDDFFLWRHLKKDLHAVHGRRQMFRYGRASSETISVRVGQDVFKETYKAFEPFNACLGAVYRYLVFYLPPVSVYLTDVKWLQVSINFSVLTGTWNLNLGVTERLNIMKDKGSSEMRKYEIYQIFLLFLGFELYVTNIQNSH